MKHIRKALCAEYANQPILDDDRNLEKEMYQLSEIMDLLLRAKIRQHFLFLNASTAKHSQFVNFSELNLQNRRYRNADYLHVNH